MSADAFGFLLVKRFAVKFLGSHFGLPVVRSIAFVSFYT